jgi:SAM-dependent methyltransferase
VPIRARRKRPSTGELAAAVLQPKLIDVLPLLRCPRTHYELKPTEDGSLVARGGEWRYPVFAGVPVLIDLEHSLLDVTAPPAEDDRLPERGASASGPRAAVARALSRLPSTDRHAAARRNHRRLVELLKVRAASGRHPRVLVIGGQVTQDGLEDLLTCAELQVIATGAAVAQGTDVVCDPHYLPFAEWTFDAVVIQGVLDSVVEPRRVAAEVHRVLAQDGLVYSEAGFIKQVRAGAFDFNRFTHLGHRRLWQCFDEVDSGAHSGPGMALLSSTEYFLRAFAGESRLLRGIIARGVALGGFWLEYLDRFLVRRPGGIDAAAGTFFLGARREAPVPDREIVAGFRGIQRGQPMPAPWPETAGVALPDEEIRISRGIRIAQRERNTSGV